MKAYSLDLRERIVNAVKSGQSQGAVAQRFGVTQTSVSRFVRQLDQRQTLTPRKASGKPPRLTQEHWHAIEGYLAQHPNATVATLQAWMHKTLGVYLSPSAVHDNLRRRGYTFKKRVWSPANATRRIGKHLASTSAR